MVGRHSEPQRKEVGGDGGGIDSLLWGSEVGILGGCPCSEELGQSRFPRCVRPEGLIRAEQNGHCLFGASTKRGAEEREESQNGGRGCLWSGTNGQAPGGTVQIFSVEQTQCPRR